MESNILIAEFMGCTNPFNDITDATLYKVEQGTFELDELEYNKSWDWLMPVVEEIKNMSGQGVLMMELGLPIEYVYGKVVEFIKENNRKNLEYESFNEAPYGE